MSLTASVVSAAILEGNLIIGLSDGSVINCGYVQGPPGLKGDPGPMGADGDAGRDGNTIITVAGTPRNDAGKDGDYAIDNVNWRIYGPKSGGTWGKANDMLPSKENLIVNGRGFEGGAGGSGDSGGGGGGEGIRLITGGDGIKTEVISDSITEIDADIDTTKGLTFASEKIAINIGTNLEFDAATGALNAASSGVFIGTDSPKDPEPVAGDLWWNSEPDDLTLYVFDGSIWAPASPPVSLDGIDENAAAITELEAVVNKLGTDTARLQSNVYQITTQTSSALDEIEESVETLESELNALQRNFDRGKWNFVEAKPATGQYALGVKVTREYCEEQYLKCLAEANNDQPAMAECNRIASECETAKDNGESTYSNTWGGADHISIHTAEADGQTHGFADYTVGKYIEIFNEGDEGNAIYQITEDAVIADGVAVIAIADIQHTGKPNGLGRFKVFEMEAGDPTEYVRKSGDTMTGSLRIKPGSLKTLNLDSGENSNLHLMRNGIEKVVVRDTDIKCIVPLFLDDTAPHSAHHAISKEYLDRRLLGTPFKWVEYVDTSTIKNLKRGEFTYDNGSSGGFAYIGSYDANGIEIFTNGQRDADFTGMLKAYDRDKRMRMAIRFKNIQVAYLQNGSNHVAQYNIHVAYRFSAENLNAEQVYYLTDGCWL